MCLRNKNILRGFFDNEIHEVNWHIATHELGR